MTARANSQHPADRLLHLGNIVVDLVLNVPELPGRGADVLAAASRATPGGGFNVLAAAARQGLHAAYAGAYGSGPFAALARSALAQEGIDLLQQPKAALDTGVVIAIVDDGGERTFLTAPGAEASLTADDLAAVRARAGDAICLSGYGLLHASNRPALVGWLERLSDSNLVIFDPGPLAGQIPAAALDAVIRRADWLTCNGREAGLLTGHAEPVAAARALAVRRSPASAGRAGVSRASTGGIIVRTGPDGCLLAHEGGEPVHVPGFPVVATDTNGAGDTHTGTFIAALARGAGAAEAARLANAAAAWSVTRPGPATAPTVTELARFLARRG